MFHFTQTIYLFYIAIANILDRKKRKLLGQFVLKVYIFYLFEKSGVASGSDTLFPDEY